jgi:lysozyme family protein
MPSFATLEPHYEALIAHATIRPEWQGEAEIVAAQIVAHASRYHAVEAATGVPWYFIGVCHQMEAGGNFHRHLHNGDPLHEATINVPAGRGPFATWEASAVDCCKLKKWADVTDWSMARFAYQAEAMNGWGYATKSQPSPYLWSGMTPYTCGKYVSDHCFDARAVSKQIGAMAILKALMAHGVANDLAPPPIPIEPEPLSAESFPRAHPEPDSPWQSKTVIAASGGGILAATQTVKEVSASVQDVKATGVFEIASHALTSTGVLMSLLILAFFAFVYKERLLKLVTKGDLT